MDEKILKMITSKDREMIQLGMKLCQEKHPAIWAALLNYTGVQTTTGIPKEVAEHILKDPLVNIGTKVRYRGMDGCPSMVITDINVTLSSPKKMYQTMVTAKYFNKGNQTFLSINERIECFEIIEDTKTAK